jgi:tetratricopeptide (TPR) repeat protein
VAGYKVVGMKTQFPIPQLAGEVPMPMNLEALTKYKVRMATVNNFVLTTSNDEQMAKLISKAKMLKKGQAKGPLMVLDYDLAAYINVFREMVPGLLDQTPIPQLDRMIMTVDASNGQGTVKSSIKMNDIRTIIAYFKGIPITEHEAKVIKKPADLSAELKSSSKDPETTQKKKAKTPEQIRASWLKKGTLASAYGDEKTAIAQFQKAIEMDPQRGDAYFHQGISYGEMGNYPKAISALSRAIELGPQKGAYHYGRGRVYLMCGESEKAIIDFKHAAELGNPDARRYLDTMDHHQ